MQEREKTPFDWFVSHGFFLKWLSRPHIKHISKGIIYGMLISNAFVEVTMASTNIRVETGPTTKAQPLKPSQPNQLIFRNIVFERMVPGLYKRHGLDNGIDGRDLQKINDLFLIMASTTAPILLDESADSNKLDTDDGTKRWRYSIDTKPPKSFSDCLSASPSPDAVITYICLPRERRTKSDAQPLVNPPNTYFCIRCSDPPRISTQSAST